LANSTGGGLYAVWSNNGRELFYETADNRIMAVDYVSADYVVTGDSFSYHLPRLWLDKQIFYQGIESGSGAGWQTFSRFHCAGTSTSAKPHRPDTCRATHLALVETVCSFRACDMHRFYCAILIPRSIGCAAADTDSELRPIIY
jgi:hypothetical protein